MLRFRSVLYSVYDVYVNLRSNVVMASAQRLYFYLDGHYLFYQRNLSIDIGLCKRGGNSKVYYIEMLDS